MNEPVLSADDVAAWDAWMRAAATHARLRSFARRVDDAKRVIAAALSRAPNAVVAWSGGKDSTVMTHLTCFEMGARLPVFSEKDDLDFPGEEDYVRSLARAWSLDLRIVCPEVSPMTWLREHVGDLAPGDDIHGRTAALSRACFYPVVAATNEGYDAVFLGLRTDESKGRRLNRAKRGRIYATAAGRLHVLPVADWSGLDVYAYAVSRDVPLLPMYRCIALMHRDEPWRLRKSWWLPGSETRLGQVVWLRRYYPSLYRTMLTMFPGASRMV